MGRWRPPPPKSSPYITPAGYAALEADLKELWVRRADVVKALAAAAAEGDRSENAEYIYRKKELGGIDSRIRYLQKRMPNLNAIACMGSVAWELCHDAFDAECLPISNAMMYHCPSKLDGLRVYAMPHPARGNSAIGSKESAQDRWEWLRTDLLGTDSVHAAA